MLKIIYY